MDIAAERAGEVKDFLARTEVDQGMNLALAERLIEFHKYLIENARGECLDPYYEKLPLEMRGYVELIYDYYNRPTIRFIESLLYESPYYNKSLQSLRLFQQTTDDARPFFMNTPRLLREDDIEWVIPFESPELDDLFKLDSTPQPLGRIRELLKLREANDSILLRLLTSEPPPPPEAWKGDDVRLRYFGHACVLIEWKGKTILTDPCLGLIPSQCGIERFTYKNLPERIDYVLVTHNHHDHYCLESLLRLRHKVDCLVVPRSAGMFYGDISLRLLSRKIGFKNVVEVDTLDSIELPDGAIVAIPFMGEHADLPHAKTAYVVRCGQSQILFAADSDCLDERTYDHIYRILGPIETVFIGMECVGAPLTWSCGSFLPAQPAFHVEQSRRYKGADSVRALRILQAVGAERLFIYAMGMEPWLEHLLGLAYSEDAVQLNEARKLLLDASEMGFCNAELLSGTREIRLSPVTRGARTRVGHTAAAAVMVEGPAGEDADEFVFD
jgi:L-ascorbate metabolism protein UlaG (beta-lactamase superfamily)